MSSPAASGTQTAVLGTTHTLATVTNPGTYVLAVDSAALVADETLELQLKMKVLSGGTSRVVWTGVYRGVQGEPAKLSLPVPVSQEIVATLKQTLGTGRDFPWSLERI